jgi:class 3 adenylate cyclase
MHDLTGKHGVYKLETIGDAWVGVCNLTKTQPDHAARIARFSIDAVSAAQKTAIHPDKPEMGNVKIRVGFHSGPVVSSVVGTKNPRYCLFGDSMNTGSALTSSPLTIYYTDAPCRFSIPVTPELRAEQGWTNLHPRRLLHYESGI